MSEKTKKNIKVRDLNPKKDAKGGGLGKPSPQGGGIAPSGGGISPSASTSPSMSQTSS